MTQPGEHDAMQSGIRLPVAATVETTRVLPARGVLDGTHPAQGGERRLSAQPLRVVAHGDQERDSGVRADTHRHEQLRGMALDESGQPLIQLIDLPRELLDALGQQPQGDASGLGHSILVAPRRHRRRAG